MPETNTTEPSGNSIPRGYLNHLLNLTKEHLRESQSSNIKRIISNPESSQDDLINIQNFLERKANEIHVMGWTSIDQTKDLEKLGIIKDPSEINIYKNSNLKTNSVIRTLKSEVSDLRQQVKTAHDEINTYKKNESNLSETIAQLEKTNTELSSLIQQERIDKEIPKYVEEVKTDLGNDDNHFIKMSIFWSAIGIIFGIGAVLSAFYTLYLKIDFKDLESLQLVYVFIRGLIGIAILSWLSHLGFNNSKRYTHESIMRKDRRHALMFGKVYLQIYGSTATKDDAIIVFKDWNMSGKSAFSEPMDQPPGLSTWLEAAKNKISLTSKETEKP